jgi:hypothetical protein
MTGALGKTKGILSEETKAKMSAARRGKPLSEETKAKMSAAKKGKTQSAFHRARVIAGRTLAFEAKAKEYTMLDVHSEHAAVTSALDALKEAVAAVHCVEKNEITITVKMTISRIITL